MDSLQIEKRENNKNPLVWTHAYLKGKSKTPNSGHFLRGKIVLDS
jgi:hypothetical protein